MAANFDNPQALDRLGHIYLYGIEVREDYRYAKKCFETSLELGNSDSYVGLGDIYMFGKGVKRNVNTAKKYYELAAKEGYLDAKERLRNHRHEILFYSSHDYFNDIISIIPKTSENKYRIRILCKCRNDDYSSCFDNLGDEYYYGDTYNQSFSKAIENYQVAAFQGDDDAICRIGMLYQNGHGVEQSYSKAKHYFEIAAKKHNPDALNNLGVLYENGFGVERDYNKANSYYVESSKCGNLYALINLGLAQIYNMSIPHNIELAKFNFQQALKKKNNSFAPLFLGLLYYDTEFTNPPDYIKAKEYFELSANLKNSDAYNYLGLFYENGYGVNKDYLKAKDYYTLAAQLKHPEAYYNLGRLHKEGKGVEKNFSKSLYFYGISAEKNYASALFYIAYLYSTGDEVEIDLKKAVSMYLKCAEIESEKSVFFPSVYHSLSIINKTNIYRYPSLNNIGLIYIEQDPKKAKDYIDYLKQAAFAEYPFAQNNYGLSNQYYLDNRQDAEYFYQRSSRNNFALAFYNLAHLYEEYDNNIDLSIENYIKASENEDSPLLFRGNTYNDKRLEISKTFIICFTNLKLTNYFFSKLNYEEAKKYFVKVFAKLGKFQFNVPHRVDKNYFSYMKKLILHNPLFNLDNQANTNVINLLNIDSNNNDNNNNDNNNNDNNNNDNNNNDNNNNDNNKYDNNKYDNNKYDNNKYDNNKYDNNKYDNNKYDNNKYDNNKYDNNKYDNNKYNNNKYDNSNNLNINNNEQYFYKKCENESENNCLFIKEILISNNSENNDECVRIFDDPDELFDFVVNENNLKHLFLKEIQEIIDLIHSILYDEKSYLILFGRISLEKKKKEVNRNSSPLSDINENFYDGLE
ncbi:hypothetical protein M9Y10_008004 [Tritrichomonas musculus]|uniref:Uncharacterized protein n=1 Tax=Tritrichomonas musculus TaxID=1915356 RepID=A0ABR2J2W7_9EUKA